MERPRERDVVPCGADLPCTDAETLGVEGRIERGAAIEIKGQNGSEGGRIGAGGGTLIVKTVNGNIQPRRS